MQFTNLQRKVYLGGWYGNVNLSAVLPVSSRSTVQRKIIPALFKYIVKSWKEILESVFPQCQSPVTLSVLVCVFMII